MLRARLRGRGLWRYENDNGLSGAYASLRINASRYAWIPELSDAGVVRRLPAHSEMAAYLDAYADEFRCAH